MQPLLLLLSYTNFNVCVITPNIQEHPLDGEYYVYNINCNINHLNCVNNVKKIVVILVYENEKYNYRIYQ